MLPVSSSASLFRLFTDVALEGEGFARDALDDDDELIAGFVVLRRGTPVTCESPLEADWDIVLVFIGGIAYLGGSSCGR